MWKRHDQVHKLKIIKLIDSNMLEEDGLEVLTDGGTSQRNKREEDSDHW